MRERYHLHGRTPRSNEPWHRRDGGARLAQDRATIAGVFPDLAWDVDDTAGSATLSGTISLVAEECGVPTTLAVRVEFPRGYPKSEPRAYDDGDAFPHVPDRHFYPDGQCCLWLPPESRWDGDDPSGLRAFLEEVAVFFDRQLVCDATGVWPGAARGHGFWGYVELVRDLLAGDDALVAVLAPVFAGSGAPGRNDPCPCGHGRKYKKCHLPVVETVVERVGADRLRQAFGRYLVHADETTKVRDPIETAM